MTYPKPDRPEKCIIYKRRLNIWGGFETEMVPSIICDFQAQFDVLPPSQELLMATFSNPAILASLQRQNNRSDSNGNRSTTFVDSVANITKALNTTTYVCSVCSKCGETIYRPPPPETAAK